MIKKYSLFIILLIGFAVAGYMLRVKTHTCNNEVISLTDSQTASIIQEARLGYITLDSAYSLIGQKVKVKWIDSLTYSIKDSLNIRDSVLFTYVPIYEADSTFTLGKDSSGVKAEVNLTLHQRFLPLQEMFASEIKVNRFNLNLPEEKRKWYENFNLVIGGGIIGDNQRVGWGVFFGAGYLIF